ncbi:hypothetical protein, partial [Mesorhizobium sp. IMUNJ 23232]|uniref:hypothetical protein n=1 Tax=Mesorhizobium sp. IMUNJ 23232 TaxID=3376064 RepID=UPI0037B5683A
MTDLPIRRHIPLYEAADQRYEASTPICRQIRPSDVYSLLAHPDSPSIGPTESALCGQCVVSTEPHLQRFPGYAFS